MYIGRCDPRLGLGIAMCDISDYFFAGTLRECDVDD